MTITEIENKLDELQSSISTQTKICNNAKANIKNSVGILGGYLSQYAELIEAVSALGTSTYETVIKGRFNAYKNEFQELQSSVEAADTLLNDITFS